ncbi:protein kinase [Nostoc sp. BAE]|nr:protein kinase [Nostoc commune BAE]
MLNQLLNIGQILDGRYRIVSVLPPGGFGQTYIAEDTKRPGNPQCVVKQLRPLHDDPTTLQIARRLFQTEAETLERLGHHDKIPQLFAYFEENQEFYLVQEFILGQALNKILLVQPLLEDQVLHLLTEVLEVLVFVHGQKVIHRDIKPDNLIRRQADRANARHF